MQVMLEVEKETTDVQGPRKAQEDKQSKLRTIPRQAYPEKHSRMRENRNLQNENATLKRENASLRHAWVYAQKQAMLTVWVVIEYNG